MEDDGTVGFFVSCFMPLTFPYLFTRGYPKETEKALVEGKASLGIIYSFHYKCLKQLDPSSVRSDCRRFRSQ